MSTSLGRKLVFACATHRAYPFIGKLFKRNSGRNITLRIPLRGIIHVTAHTTHILFHMPSPFLKDITHFKNNPSPQRQCKEFAEQLHRQCRGWFSLFVKEKNDANIY
jgi:hypothetical protein